MKTYAQKTHAQKAALALTVMLFGLSCAVNAQAGTIVKTTFHVVSVTVPQRAAMLNLATNTEFKIYTSNGFYYEIVNPGGGTETSISIGSNLNKGLADKYVVFTHSGGGATYTPRIRMTTIASSTHMPNANCTDVAAASRYVYDYYWDGAAWTSACCPSPPAYSTSYSYHNMGSITDAYFNLPGITQ